MLKSVLITSVSFRGYWPYPTLPACEPVSFLEDVPDQSPKAYSPNPCLMFSPKSEYIVMPLLKQQRDSAFLKISNMNVRS